MQYSAFYSQSEHFNYNYPREGSQKLIVLAPTDVPRCVKTSPNDTMEFYSSFARFHGSAVFLFKISRTLGCRKVLFLTAPDEMYVPSVTLSSSCRKSVGGARWFHPPFFLSLSLFTHRYHPVLPFLPLPPPVSHQAAASPNSRDSRRPSLSSLRRFPRLHYLSRRILYGHNLLCVAAIAFEAPFTANAAPLSSLRELIAKRQ